MLEKQLTSKSYKANHQGWELVITENVGEGLGIVASGDNGDGGHLSLEISNDHLSFTMNPHDIDVITYLVNHFTTESNE